MQLYQSIRKAFVLYSWSGTPMFVRKTVSAWDRARLVEVTESRDRHLVIQKIRISSHDSIPFLPHLLHMQKSQLHYQIKNPI